MALDYTLCADGQERGRFISEWEAHNLIFDFYGDMAYVMAMRMELDAPGSIKIRGGRIEYAKQKMFDKQGKSATS